VGTSGDGRCVDIAVLWHYTTFATCEQAEEVFTRITGRKY
jgi:hypothetical protein